MLYLELKKKPQEINRDEHTLKFDNVSNTLSNTKVIQRKKKIIAKRKQREDREKKEYVF